jgi:type I restriction enzyme S subunit
MARFSGGGTPTRDNPDFWNGDIPWVSPKDMKTQFITGAEECITAEGLAGSSSSMVPSERVLMVVRSGILKHTIPVAINTVPVALNQDMKAIFLDPDYLSARFFMRWVQGLNHDLLKVWLKQGATVESIEQDYLSDTLMPVPPVSERELIVKCLDRETVRIDALIEKKTRFIELLREKRQALITHAVTQGLDPSVKMKNSGVEWLGEVPEHWEIKQLKHVVDPNSSITYGIVQAGPEFLGGVPYIRTSDMSADELPISGYPLTSPEIDESYARSRVRPGDIVMSIRASVGKCLPVPEDLSVANLTQGTAKVSPGNAITRDFLLTFLNSSAAQVYFDLMAKGATFKEITLDALRRTPVLVPPQTEQKEIDQFIARHIGRLNQLCLLSERSIGMLKERRSALITAAVTGQIDLREAV